MSIAFTDIDGNPFDDEYIEEELFNFLKFEDAAKAIDPYFTRSYLYRLLSRGLLRRDEILVIIDESLKLWYPDTGGKIMYVHKDEVERFKREELPRILATKAGRKRKKDICLHCRRKFMICANDPCRGRREEKIEDERRRRLAIQNAKEAKSVTKI